jgi:hypothetical protein
MLNHGQGSLMNIERPQTPRRDTTHPSSSTAAESRSMASTKLDMASFCLSVGSMECSVISLPLRFRKSVNVGKENLRRSSAKGIYGR